MGGAVFPQEEGSMKEALYYRPTQDTEVRCFLCPHLCVIKDGAVGFCGVRKNEGGRLYALNYGRVASISLDPVEKKPLYHYHPGESILSVGTVGCNFTCFFCQNWTISQDTSTPTQPIQADWLVEKTKEVASFGIAYTYNEPFIWYEFVLETASLAKKAGLENVLVTNGYVSPGPLKKLLPFIDAMNIDLKSIRDEFYGKFCSGGLKAVQETIKCAVKSCHVELTNLIIPTLNDTEEELYQLVDWIHDNLGASVPLHFSRYFPCYKMDIPATPVATLKMAHAIAIKKLKHVHLGNV